MFDTRRSSFNTRRSTFSSEIIPKDEPKQEKSVFISELMTNMIKKKKREE